ncbi:hypothetical protein [Leuconostoc mesenteroides]|uniref:hypothetical protein n=2 Tax=Leuconostoc mesenteroides TaxID=1245 RepID=UPI001FBB3A76|nr:hypothetical protein [Leuconostoc mesenteroides]MCJ2158582.1 hypothetical protein [Leuconostoc mesenteroides]MCM6835993.1 hypothetical protein [Leuconostoc mesenteroides]
MMWFLQVMMVFIIAAIIFVGGLIQGEAQERDRQKRLRHIKRMGGTDGSNKYMRAK